MFILLVHKNILLLIINDKKALLIIITEVSLAKNKHLRIKRKLVCQLTKNVKCDNFVDKHRYEDYDGVVLKENIAESSKGRLMPKYILLFLIITTLLLQGFGAYKTARTFDSPQFLEHKV